MFKLVVLSALVAIATSKPSGLHVSSWGLPAVSAYSAPLLSSAVLPAATSTSHRVDVHHRSLVLAEQPAAHQVSEVPVVAEAPVVAAPVVAETPVVAARVAALPAAVSSSSRVDVHQKSLVVAETPVVPAVHAVETVPVVAESPVIAARYASPWVADAPLLARSVVSPVVATQFAHSVHQPYLHSAYSVHPYAHSGLVW